MSVLEVYLDLPLWGALLAVIEDATLLWMVAQLSGEKPSWLRLWSGGLLGGLFNFFLLTNQLTEGIVFPWILNPLVILLLPVVMILVVFYFQKFSRLMRIFGYFYLLAFLLSGVQWGVDMLNHYYFHWELNFWWKFCLHEAIILIIGELGWGVIHQQVWEHLCLYPIQITWDTHQIKLNALLDTGNRLHDPLTKVPVVIVELNLIKGYLPEEMLCFIEQIQQGELDYQWDLPLVWMERVRVLPFNSIGQEHGILVGFRPDRLTVWQKELPLVSNEVVIGLYKHALSPEGAFQALIPPAVLQ